MLSRHPINIEFFNFDNLSIESNLKPPKNLKEINNNLKVAFKIQPHKSYHFRKKICIKFIINEAKQDFEKSLYRIKGTARLEISLAEDMDEEKILEQIRISGLYLLFNTLRAYLSQMTSSFGWGPFFLPCLDIDKLIEKDNFQKILEISPNGGMASKPRKTASIRSKKNIVKPEFKN